MIVYLILDRWRGWVRLSIVIVLINTINLIDIRQWPEGIYIYLKTKSTHLFTNCKIGITAYMIGL